MLHNFIKKQQSRVMMEHELFPWHEENSHLHPFSTTSLLLRETKGTRNLLKNYFLSPEGFLSWQN